MRYKKSFIFILFMAFLGSAATLWAFSEPTANPPGNNVRPPINQTEIRQDKKNAAGTGGQLGVQDLFLGVGSPPEGDMRNIDELIGYNDLILRGSPGNANPIYIEGNPVVINNDPPNASVGIGVVPNPSFKLDIGGVTRLGSLAADPVPASSAPGAIYYNTALGKFRCYQGAAWTDCGSGAGGGLTGTGLPGQVTFWNSATALAGSNNLFWDNTNSRLGIGTAIPGHKLHVAGDTRITGHIGLSDSVPSALYQISSQDVQTDPSGDTVGSRFVNYTDTTVSVARNLYGSLSYAIPRSAVGTTNSGTGIGMYGIGRADGAGAVTTVEGVRGLAQSNSATAAITSAIGLRAFVTQTAGVITNGYGVYINDVQGTNQYGIYQVGSTDTNYFAGDVGIGDPTPAYKLDVTGDINSTGVYRVDGIAGVSGPVTCAAGFTPNNITINGGIVTAAGACTPIGGSGGLTGGGTVNYLSKFTGASVLGNSQIFDNGASVGIGTAVPGAKLEVSGATTGIRVTDTDPAGNAFIQLSTVDGGLSYFQNVAGRTRIVVGGGERMTFLNTGEVGIGVASPIERLEVNGNIKATKVFNPVYAP